jgi:hypothetical protein
MAPPSDFGFWIEEVEELKVKESKEPGPSTFRPLTFQLLQSKIQNRKSKIESLPAISATPPQAALQHFASPTDLFFHHSQTS